MPRVAVIGATGQAGKIHCQNLLDLGCQVMAVTRESNRHKTLENFDIKDDLSELVSQGYDKCLICSSDTVLAIHL